MNFLLFFFSFILFLQFNSSYPPSTNLDKDVDKMDLFVQDSDGYHSYRIPSLIVTQKGNLLAFAEGRKNGVGDTGNIDMLLKRSEDGGKTWSEPIVVWDDGDNVCGNPSPVVDETTGTIWLLMTWNRGDDHEGGIIQKTSKDSRRVFVTSSKDEGKTWDEPKEITDSTKDPSWGWYATGPGIGIQIQNGPHKGRMVIPCDHSYDDPEGKLRGGPFEFGSHTIYSDDNGTSWHLDGVIRPKVNECQVVEIADGKGTLLMDLRSYFNRNRRTHSISYDGGKTWSPPKDAPELVEPVCQASIIRYSWPDQNTKSKILFSNPASTKRENLTIKLSLDEGKSWPVQKTLHAGPSAYSSLAVLPNGEILCFYEGGRDNPYEKMILARFKLDWLEHSDKLAIIMNQ